MPGHGSTPPPDRGSDPSRVVTRQSGMQYSQWFDTVPGGGRTLHEVSEYRPEVGYSGRVSDTGTRFRYNVIQSNVGGGVWGNRQGDVRTLKRAQVAARGAGRRLQTKYMGG